MSEFYYTFGGDEFLYCELSKEYGMTLDAFFQSMSICNKLKALKIEGITEICPANASYMIRFDPDILDHEKALSICKDLEKEILNSQSEIECKIVELPVWYQDKFTTENRKKFKDRHQEPDLETDIEYCAKINNYANIDEFIKAHAGSPWFISMVGFVAGLPWLFQLVERERQIEAPKYVISRTDTPKLTIGHGGCFGSLYSVRGAGGYQTIGITPIDVWDPELKINYFNGEMVFFNPGDLVKYKPCNEAEWYAIRKQIEENTYQIKSKMVKFSLSEWKKDVDGYNKKLMEALDD